MKTNEFSLIELLVLIAIIGILTSLLLPSLSSAREKSKTSVCKSNQKQISVSLFLFKGDHDGYYPMSVDGGWSWTDNISSYDGRNLTDAEKNQNGLTGSKAGVYSCSFRQSCPK